MVIQFKYFCWLISDNLSISVLRMLQKKLRMLRVFNLLEQKLFYCLF